MTLTIEPSDSGVRFATSQWVWSGELHRAVRAFNILREVIGGGFHGVEIYASGGAPPLEPSRQLLLENRDNVAMARVRRRPK